MPCNKEITLPRPPGHYLPSLFPVIATPKVLVLQPFLCLAVLLIQSPALIHGLTFWFDLRPAHLLWTCLVIATGASLLSADLILTCLIRLHGSTLTCLIWCQKAWTMLEAGHHCWIHAAQLARYSRAVWLVVRLLPSLLAACPALQPERAACPWAPWVHLCTLHLPNSHRLLHWPGSNGSIHWNLIKLGEKNHLHLSKEVSILRCLWGLRAKLC